MANKWKYASLPASERISRIRGGDKDVFDSEIARSLDVIKSRGELGLDTAEQRAWIDEINYNYNLAGAEKMGTSPSLVNQTGYAAKLLGEDSPRRFGKGAYKPGTLINKASEQRAAAQELQKELAGKLSEVRKERAATEEWLVNNGIDTDSVDGKKFLAQADKEIADQSERLKKEYLSALKARLASIR